MKKVIFFTAFLISTISYAFSIQLPGIYNTQEAPKYFGYYANSVQDSFRENLDHVNLHQVAPFGMDPQTATNFFIQESMKAKAVGAHTLLTVDTFLFKWSDKNAIYNPDAPQLFSNMVNALIEQGLLIPNDPVRGTVVGFYVIDEPELYGLQDGRSVANSNLAQAISVIVNNPNTTNFPKATTFTPGFSRKIGYGAALFDWIGVDCYSSCGDYFKGSGSWPFTEVQAVAHDNNQKIVLVPQAGVGPDLDNNPDNPYDVFNLAKTDDSIIAIMPFVWFTGDGHRWTGARDLPDLRAAYTDIGQQIKAKSDVQKIKLLNAGSGCDDFYCMWFIIDSSNTNIAVDMYDFYDTFLATYNKNELAFYEANNSFTLALRQTERDFFTNNPIKVRIRNLDNNTVSNKMLLIRGY